jgi:uncharacterized RDD family membrane protein YckC
MDSIDILTGQHITLKYKSASIASRMLALLLDYIFMFAYFFALVVIAIILTDNNIDIFKWDISTIIFGILCLPILFYHVVFESLMNGQTPGKVIAKIRVINIDGSTPNFLSYFLRWALLLIDLQPVLYGGVGAFLIIFTKNHQRLGDLAAGTTVIKLTPSTEKYNLEQVFNEFPTDYQPTFPQAESLTEGQIRLISELLENPSEETTIALSIHNLAFKIKKKLNIETKMNNREFLETIVKDYHFYER